MRSKSRLMLDAGGQLTVSAITSGQVEVAYLFSTDPGIAANDLVVLEDDQTVFGTENILPILPKTCSTCSTRYRLPLLPKISSK